MAERIIDRGGVTSSLTPPLTPIIGRGLPPISSGGGSRRGLLTRKFSLTGNGNASASPVLGGASAPAVFEEGTYAWLPDSNEVVVPVKVHQSFKRGENGLVVRLRPNESSYHNEEETTRTRKLSLGSRRGHHLRASMTTLSLSPAETEKLVRADDTSLVPTANMIDMVDLSEATLLHNLRLRFFEKVVYTSIGTILVSVNPFEALPLYTPDVVDKYRFAGSHVNRWKLGPHVYALAHDAYANMIERRQDQSCIVTGESGSGKTELTKLFLQYLMELSRSDEEDKKIVEEEVTAFDENYDYKGGGIDLDGDVDFRQLPLSTRILTANPLLESFGNAMTTRNDNSSRHGKWISVAFHKKKGSVMGANVQVYLLEKSRLVHRGAGERNFHIFYELLAGAASDPFLRESLQLEGGIQSFKYLTSELEERNKDNEAAVSARASDARSWAQTLRSLRSIGTSREEEGQLLQVLAGLLHLGNIEFTGKGEMDAASSVANKDVLDVASELLGFDSAMLETSLTKKDVSNSKEKLFQNRSSDQAREARDALAKFVYGRLFDWVVARVGVALGPAEEHRAIPHSTIGMLDVFGFEVFERNSFEQLCINYANEKLQEQFNRKVFEMELEEYLTQGMAKSEVDALFTHISNAECLNMFEEKPNGIFTSLEDEIFVPRGSDATFVSKLAKFAPLECFQKVDALRFKIVHYAGEVEYDATSFLEKSRDRIDPILETLPSKSTGILSKIVGAASNGVSSPAHTPPTSKKKENKTLGTKFVTQLNELLDALDMTEPHYARCIKPNDLKAPEVFKAKMVMSQLRYSGLLDVCRVRKRGYPVRLDFEEFAWRYGNMTIAAQPPPRSLKEKCEMILNHCKIDKQSAFVGTSKVLLNHSCYDKLELLRDEALRLKVTVIQKLARGRLSRISIGEIRTALGRLSLLVSKNDFSANNLRELEEQLVALREVPQNHPTIAAALALKRRFESRSLVLDLISRVTTIQEAEIAKKEAVAAGIAPDDPCLEDVNRMLERQTELSNIRSELELAMETRDLTRLERSLADLKLLEGTKQVADRIRSTSFTQEKIQDARTLRDRLIKEKDALESTEQAIKDDASIDVLKAAYKRLLELNMDKHPTALAASKLLKQKKRKENESKDLTALRTKGSEDAKQTLSKLKVAENSKDLKALAEARHEALELGLDRVPDVQRAARLMKQLEEENDMETSLGAATEVVLAKAALKSGTGLSFHDVERLSEAIMVARQRGISLEAPQYVKATETEREVRAQIKIQTGLEDAMKDRNYAKVNQLLQDAAKLNLDNDLVRRARAVSSKRTGGDNGAKIGRTVSLKDRALEMKKLSQKDFEKRRMERLREARDAKHDWWNLEEKQVLRPTEDFAAKRGAMFSTKLDKKLVKAKWKYSGKVIPKSLTAKCDKDERTAKRAVLINKAMLGFCGDLVLPFPSVLAQQMLEAALLDPPLADELWVQLMRQLTENPYEDSERRAWMLCAVCASCVGPASVEVENAVLHFLIVQSIESAGMDPVNKEYARYTLRRFEKIILEGPSGAIPTNDEIKAYQERPPMLATVNLPDGRELTREYPVAPDVTVQEFVEACCVTFDIRTDLAYLFGLFVEVKAQDVTDRRTRTLKRMELAQSIDNNASSYTATSASNGPSLVNKSGTAKPPQSSARTVTFQTEQPAKSGGGVMRRVSNSMLNLKKPGLLSGSAGDRTSMKKSESASASTFASVVEADPEAESGKSFAPEPQVLGRATSRLKLAPSKNKLRQKQMPEKVPEPLPATEYLGDVFTHHIGRSDRIQFIFRRKIISPPGQEPPGALKERSFLEMCYLEAVEEVICGNWACVNKDDAATIAALILTDLRGGKAPATISANMTQAVQEFLPVPWRNTMSNMEWAKLIMSNASRIKVMGSRDTRRAFLSKVEKLPTFGLICFPVRRGNEILILGCGARGIVLLDTSNARTQLSLVPHLRVRKIDAFSESLSVDVWDESLTKVKERQTYATSQAHEIAALLWEYSARFN